MFLLYQILDINMKQAMEKVRNGKLLIIKLEINNNNKILKTQILGDFFAHPESIVTKLEDSLKNLDILFDEQEVIVKLNNIIKENNAEIIGMDADAVVRVMKKAIGEES